MTETILGEGIGFEDVEQLRKNITTMEYELLTTREEIRTKTEAMQNEKALKNAELRELQENMRIVKTQCEQALKDRKKELNDQLKQKRHELTINEVLREEKGFNKTDWKDEVKIMTKEQEANIPKIVEKLKQEQDKNINKFETQIQTFTDKMVTDYGTVEEEIRNLLSYLS